MGNGISPQEVIQQYGADVLRLWVASADYQSDITISREILKQMSEAYRKIRNTARYILGNLYDFDPNKDFVSPDDFLPIDKWAMIKLNDLIATVIDAYDKYEFHQVYHSIHKFCVVDMSNFYLDVLKDRLYTEKADSKERRAAQTVMYHILESLTLMLAPILAYTSDEIWRFMPHADDADPENVLFNDMPGRFELEVEDGFEAAWDRIHDLRDTVKKSLEVIIKDKTVKSSLETCVTLKASGDEYEFIKSILPELKTVFIVSDVKLVENSGELEVEVAKAEGDKCERCWCYSTTVGSSAEHPTLCARCAAILSK
jgi:isoleucyl-tRNA synthetase